MPSGIHHVTGITKNVQANVDFYMGFLGLHLVKQTGGYEDAEQLHLFYGDVHGAPGSVVSFLVWEDGATGRVGEGQAGEIAFAVPLDSIGEWLTRALDVRMPVEQPTREFGETVLRLKDPDGIIVKLVGTDLGREPLQTGQVAPTRLRAVTLFSGDPAATAEFAEKFGYRMSATEGQIQRMVSDTDAIDIRDTRGFFSGIPGTGVLDHVAFRAPDAAALREMRVSLARAHEPTNVHDRKYFLSLYARDPAGLLFEYATDAPGFAVDEPAGHLGETLLIPDHDTARAADLRAMLPQFAQPGEPRMPKRSLPFVHRFRHPEDPDGSVMLLLHGTGGNEADLMPLAAGLTPRATLLGVRGRATEEHVTRFFRRFDVETFDQEDIRAEARAFEAFLHAAVQGYGLDTEAVTVLGYSNGANFAASVMALHPGLIRRAILLRAIPVLIELPQVDLSSAQVLLLTGRDDPLSSEAPRLAQWLQDSGAGVESEVVEAGHEISPADLNAARAWLTR
ncbi:VOC family protein [Tritonibacter sp. SIMBA_163]|uniref:VOC family protein n=1 Tax=Tritonibacter sp. SIMBA_163 TaxID=3080868 RepID=UPI00398128AB